MPRPALFLAAAAIALAACSSARSSTVGSPSAAIEPGAPTSAQRDSLLGVVRGLFDAMRRGDSAAVRAIFHPRASLMTASIREGQPMVRGDSLEPFVRAVGTPHTDVWDERLREAEVSVRVDQNLATVWAPYAFFAGPRFSHCGVNTFTLARDAQGWRIITLADTRRRTGCPEAG